MSNFDPTKPVQTRDGRAARIICTNRKMARATIDALVTQADGSEFLEGFGDTGGVHNSAYRSANDLVNIPEKRFGWMNIYPATKLFASREDADDASHAGRVSCIKVEFEIETVS